MSSGDRKTKRKSATEKIQLASLPVEQSLIMPANSGTDDTIFRIPPYYFIHVLDQNRNVTRGESRDLAVPLIHPPPHYHILMLIAITSGYCE